VVRQVEKEGPKRVSLAGATLTLEKGWLLHAEVMEVARLQVVLADERDPPLETTGAEFLEDG
jgi:hypothetical protein